MVRPSAAKPLVLLLLLAAGPAAMAQDIDDTGKLLPPTCDAPSPQVESAPLTPVELDEAIDIANPVLGFYQPESGSVSEAKAESETCSTEDPPTASEDYDKTDDPDRLLAQCASPFSLEAQAGVRDHYALPYDPANLTAEIMAATGILDPSRWVGFDADHPNFHFGHNFQLSFTSFFGYRTGKLTLHLRPIKGDYSENDTLSLWVTGASRGWGSALVNLGYTLTPGQETTVELDLRTLSTGTSSILADINLFHNLNVYIQDDTSVDSMTLTLACDGSAIPTPLVGVIPGPAGCGTLPEYDVFLDNEDNSNANNRGGWIGATVSNRNTLFRLCGVDGRLFSPAAWEGANFAVVALAPTCPEGFTRFDRFHDNEDQRPASWDNAPSGSPTYTVQPEKNTNMAFCVATGTNLGVANSFFPNLGVSYGVFGGRTARGAAWALDRGYVFLDDERRRNRNRPVSPPAYTWEFLEPGANTTYFLSQVAVDQSVNLARLATASASSTYPFEGYAAARINDGNQSTALGGASSWVNADRYAPNGFLPQWVQLDFGMNQTFSRVVVFTTAGFPIRDFQLQVWNGITWTTIAQTPPGGNTAPSIALTFPSTTARFVRILGTLGPAIQPQYVRVNELEVYR
jgi:hypothetical protein